MRVMFAVAAAAAATASAAVIERPQLTMGWSESALSLAGDVVAQDDQFTFDLLVREQNVEQLREFVGNVSDPDHSMYGQRMTGQEVLAYTQPLARDTKTVTDWLDSAGVEYDVDDFGRRVTVTCTVAQAEELLSTKISTLVNKITNQDVVRATDYELPDEVSDATDAVFGLHGLPIPIKPALVSVSAGPEEPADVTPAVLASTYDITGVTPKGTTTNRMAVAEFQGQNEEDSDLVAFFKKFLPDAQEGDDKVYKFVGDKDKQSPGVEASLDIQYIMGVAPHIKAEFWLWDDMDFCADLEKWSSEILTQGTDAPRVHSVSYGWQGNLTQVQCDDTKVGVVDNNFLKIAATDSTIVFASGDSGSGYAPPHVECNAPTKDTANEGTVAQTQTVQNYEECCEYSGIYAGAGYTFTPNSTKPAPGATCAGSDIGTPGHAYIGKAIQVFKIPSDQPALCCEIARGASAQQPRFFSYEPVDGKTGNCSIFDAVTGSKKTKGAYSGKPQVPVQGKCEIFSKISGTKPSTGAQSGTLPPAGKVQLFPSWPASSPYVTAVGATRFVEQTVGQPEMASDQFGSGGGFSDMFDQTHATWQTAAVKHYTSNPPQDPHYPPAGSFNPDGRATPDVSALGEGYQVFTGGQAQPVGGTSASAPAFAGMLALINEGLEQAGKKPLGFVNPFLYKNSDCFTDVTLGTNAIGRGTGPIKYGFNATAGWDPATGLGTPVFSKLLAAALK